MRKCQTDLLQGKRDLLILAYLRYAEVSKQTYYRPKETYSHAKRDLQITGIPEVCPYSYAEVSKETYYKAKETY